MIKSAPYMTRPIPMMIPIYRWWEVPMLWVTGQLYDLIAGRRRTVYVNQCSHYCLLDHFFLPSLSFLFFFVGTARESRVSRRGVRHCHHTRSLHCLSSFFFFPPEACSQLSFCLFRIIFCKFKSWHGFFSFSSLPLLDFHVFSQAAVYFYPCCRSKLPVSVAKGSGFQGRFA